MTSLESVSVDGMASAAGAIAGFRRVANVARLPGVCPKTAWAGGFAINLRGRFAFLKVQGREHIRVYQAMMEDDSGAQALSPLERRFCGVCGSMLWCWDPRWPDLIHPFALRIWPVFVLGRRGTSGRRSSGMGRTPGSIEATMRQGWDGRDNIPSPARRRAAKDSVAGIFISYRREDASGHAGALMRALETHFAPKDVFLDTTDIRRGEAFPEALAAAIRQADVVLVLISARWLDARDAAGRRRLDDPADYVRHEVALGLRDAGCASSLTEASTLASFLVKGRHKSTGLTGKTVSGAGKPHDIP